MDAEHSAEAVFTTEAETLRALAANKDTPLWPADGTKTRVDVSMSSQDKGLSYLAKRAYERLGYTPEQAKDACILLAALFVEKLGPDPKLDPHAQLSIFPDHAELIVEGKNVTVEFPGAEKRPDGPAVRLGMDLLSSPDGDAERKVARGLRFEASTDVSLRDFFIRFYRTLAHYGIQDASVAAESLLQRFAPLKDAPISLENGDLLLIFPDKAVLQTRGTELTVSLAEEAQIHEAAETARAAVLERSREERVLLRDQVERQDTEEARNALKRFNSGLGKRLVALVPGVLVYAKGPFGNGQQCNVFVNQNHYAVLQDARGTYRVFRKDGPHGALGAPVTDWTEDFEVVKNALI